MQPDGLHLPRSLDRIARQKSPDDPARIYSRVAGRLSDLSGLHVRTLHVEADDTRELLTIKLHEIDGMVLPARSQWAAIRNIRKDRKRPSGLLAATPADRAVLGVR